MVSDWTRNLSPEEVMKQLQEAGVPAGVVQNGEDLSNDPQLHHRQYFWELDHAEIGRYPHLGEPITMSETPPTGRMPAPCLGEHTDYVCREILGMAASEVEELKFSDVFI